MTPLFEAITQAIEEAVINAKLVSETMEDIDGNETYALPNEILVQVLEKYRRMFQN